MNTGLTSKALTGPIAVAMVGIALGSPTARAWALDCKNAVTTPDLNECADRDFKAADRRLNEAYRQALGRIDTAGLPPEGQRAYRQALQDAQRKWIPFRDAECELARFDAYGGTMATMIGIGCLTKQTEGRIKDLQGIAASQ
ncbi:lysozyme inhibitor LprI family protein [Methylobacterium sp. E-066]|nr:lysozyme inhibitor LprI family protein [Methylobacterium sp. E-066]MCJ2140428.1 lysozyme inhibitor LprI family protein [Methylobacterium sp. E-066]